MAFREVIGENMEGFEILLLLAGSVAAIAVVGLTAYRGFSGKKISDAYATHDDSSRPQLPFRPLKRAKRRAQ